MGQTLTHGIYLPDEGERNCYNGLAANWQLLDGAVGTIAEHTTQIAGKAPLVHTHGKADITDLLNSNFIPSANNSYDLGSSSYQWNNLYAKNYFYNGTAWGLDKANVWSAENTYTYSIALKQINLEKGELPASNQTRRYRFPDKNNSDLGWLQHRVSTSGDSYLECLVANKFSNGQLSTQGNEIINSLVLGLSGDGARYLKVLGDVYPDLPTRVCNLGTSTNKWKTLNGINPGALSLPVTALDNTYDISGDITDLTGGNNSITAARTGWIFVKSDNATEISIENTTTGMGASDHSAAAATLMVSIPVTSGETLNIIANCTSIDKAYLLPCQGNV